MSKIGISFPFVTDGRGSIQTSNSLLKNIEDCIKQILLTKKGERVMLPDFGCDLWRVAFDNDFEIMAELSKEYIKDAISQWEPRVSIDDVVINKDGEYLYIEITYEIINSNIPLQAFSISYQIV